VSRVNRLSVAMMSLVRFTRAPSHRKLWLPKDRRQTAEQAAAFAKKAMEQNQLQSSRRDPYERMMGWLLPRVGRP
jgi:hypothetical protein